MTDEPEDTFSDLDTLMLQPPLDLTKQDLDRIIAYQRKMRIQREAGVKVKKPKDAPVNKIDISSLLAQPAGGVKRRF